MERIEMQLMFKLSIVMQAIIVHPQMESLKEFLENSTIHGLCYISTSRFKTFNHSIKYISSTFHQAGSQDHTSKTFIHTIYALDYIYAKYTIFAQDHISKT